MKYRFEGWYVKHQKGEHTLALIPGRSGKDAFVQVVTDQRAWNVEYPRCSYHPANPAWVGSNRFSKAGIVLDLKAPGLVLTGRLRYGALSPLQYDVMGPLAPLPLECRHHVVSMRHSLTGALCLNGEQWDFTGGLGYIEGDEGYSFPQRYTWVQCNAFDSACSIMASAAKIPVAGGSFWGCVAVVWLDGREYRIASYNGGRIIKRTQNHLLLARGPYCLEIRVPVNRGHALSAPQAGRMVRSIHESPSCTAHFRFTYNGVVLFEQTSEKASYEYVEE